MHPNRRRKKRPNYGFRTVEVARGGNGFGFTISGQQPCIVSCIVQHSPADLSGLRAGDFLISVNGISVSKLAHDAVVNLIGKSPGAIQMTIAEHYYSDSSDDDVGVARIVGARKHKPRLPRRKKNFCLDEQPNETASGTSPLHADDGGPIEYKAFVGYVGTIEMPKQTPSNCRLQMVSGCIKKLRQERRKPTAVLMTVLPTCLTLKNASNQLLAIYPTNRVVYISAEADREPRFFGLVTSAQTTNDLNIWPGNGEEKGSKHVVAGSGVSNSCHVFATEPKLIEHAAHASKAGHFRIGCTRDLITGYCLEFPRNALYIVSLVQNMYRLQSEVVEGNEMQANSPQPSASSNSDSGIGFRDECANVSDRILVVEFPQEKITAPAGGLHAPGPQPARPGNILASNFEDLNNVRAMGSTVGNVRALEMSPGGKRTPEADLFKKPTMRKRGKRLWSLVYGSSSSSDLLAKYNLDCSYKLSPKVYMDTPRKKSASADEFGGSLKDLRLFGRKLYTLAQSEPDVRTPGSQHFPRVSSC